MSFPRLFSPLVIGPVEARNRVVCGAHFTMYTEPNRTYGEPGFYGERYGRYLAEYARGGVGTVIAGQAQVHPGIVDGAHCSVSARAAMISLSAALSSCIATVAQW